MARYWPSSFFCVFMVHKHANKERGQYPTILTEQAWAIKDLSYGIKHQNMINFPCGTKPVSRASKIAPSCPLGQPITVRDSAHLTRSRSQSIRACTVHLNCAWKLNFAYNFVTTLTSTMLMERIRINDCHKNLTRNALFS